MPDNPWEVTVGLPNVVPLTEAAAFTFGCAVLQAKSLNPERVSWVLACIVALLIAGVLLALTPRNISIDPNALDPAALWPLSGHADGRPYG
jgi:ABC-type cobalamin transport system permease subunit